MTYEIIFLFLFIVALAVIIYNVCTRNRESETPETENSENSENDFDEDTPVFNDFEAPTLERLKAENYNAKVILIIGNEYLDSFQYGNDGALGGVITDLENVHAFYVKKGGWLNIYGEHLGNFERDVIHEKKATARALYDAVEIAAKYLKLVPGKNIFKIYSSGHGSQRWKRGDDADNYSETYVMYDQVVFDDDFNAYIDEKCNRNIDVLIETDRCFAGGLSRASLHVGVSKYLPSQITKNVKAYTRMAKETISKPRKKYLASSAEKETSGDLGAGIGGEYTSKAYDIRRKCADKISYADFISQCRAVVKGQTPKLANAWKEKTDWRDTVCIE
jgi:Caspase domain